jgi:ML-like domain
VVYYIPDLDGQIEAQIKSANNSTQLLACVETEVSNGKSVMHTAVSCVLAVLFAFYFSSAAFFWYRGFHTTAVHLYTKAFGLMTYCQGISLFGK